MITFDLNRFSFVGFGVPGCYPDNTEECKEDS